MLVQSSCRSVSSFCLLSSLVFIYVMFMFCSDILHFIFLQSLFTHLKRFWVKFYFILCANILYCWTNCILKLFTLHHLRFILTTKEIFHNALFTVLTVSLYYGINFLIQKGAKRYCICFTFLYSHEWCEKESYATVDEVTL